MQYKSDNPVYQETYYQDAPITTRLVADAAPISTGLLGGILIGVGLFLLGWRAGYAVGVLQPWVEARGWIVLLFLAIGLPVLTIYYNNRKG